jgi:hypothetical protein
MNTKCTNCELVDRGAHTGLRQSILVHGALQLLCWNAAETQATSSSTKFFQQPIMVHARRRPACRLSSSPPLPRPNHPPDLCTQQSWPVSLTASEHSHPTPLRPDQTGPGRAAHTASHTDQCTHCHRSTCMQAQPHTDVSCAGMQVRSRRSHYRRIGTRLAQPHEPVQLTGASRCCWQAGVRVPQTFKRPAGRCSFQGSGC